MVTLAGPVTRQDPGLHAERTAGPAQSSRAFAVRNRAELRPVRRGQGPASARHGGGGVADVGRRSVSAPNEGASQGGGGVRRRGRAAAGRQRQRAARAPRRATPGARCAAPEMEVPPTQASPCPTAAGVGLVGYKGLANARSPAGIRFGGSDYAGKGTEPAFSMLDYMGESDIYLSTHPSSVYVPLNLP